MTVLADAPTARRAARLGPWALPVYGVLLGLGTLTQPPPVEDFDAYARYTTTGTFLLSHIGGSIGGGLAISARSPSPPSSGPGGRPASR